MISPTQMDLLELDIDTRISDLWKLLQDYEEFDFEIVASFMRAAYAQGYRDAFTEPLPQNFFLDNGYQVPKRRTTRVDL